jgi:hypothetical protein
VTSRSFGHFILASTPKSQSALATPTAATWVKRGARWAGIRGRSTSENQRPPGGEPQRRASRPRPPFWTFEITIVPCGTPGVPLANSRARSWVEPISSWKSTCFASGLPSLSTASLAQLAHRRPRPENRKARYQHGRR